MIGGLTSMLLFFGLFWKSGVMLGAALGLNLLLRKKSADLRRLVLSTAVVALLISMAAAPALPRWTAPMPSWLRLQQTSHDSPSYQTRRESRIAEGVEFTPYNVLPSSPRPGSRRTDFTTQDFTPWLLPLIWALGAGILLIRFTVSLYGLRRLREASEPMTDPGVLVAAARYGVVARLMQNETIAAPVTWGFLRPILLVPAGFEALAPECREAVLCHELAHVQARDFLMRSLAEITRAALWFQPLMWIVRRQLHEEQELACDDRVLASGGKASVYAKLLMDWDARSGMDFLIAMGIANRSCLKRRLYALLDPALRRNHVTPVWAAGAWMMALAFALPLAAVGVTQDASPRKTPVVAVHSESLAAVPQSSALPVPVEIAQSTAVPPRGTQRPANEPGPAAIVPATADTSITGDWRGSVNLSGRPGRFVLHIAYAVAALTATFDSPDVAILGGKVDAITLAGPTLRFAIQYPDVNFSGDLSSNDKIVGTLVRGGMSFPMVLTRTIDPPVQSQIFARPSLPVAGSVYHHDRSDIEFTLPAGWSVGQLVTATNDPGEMAVLINPDHKPVSATVWMFRIETHPQDIPDWLDASLKRKLASRAGKTGAVIEATIDGYRVRPGSEQHTTVNGYQSLWAIGEFGEAKDAGTELLVFVCGEHGRVYFDLRGKASQIAAVQPAFEELIQSVKIP